MKYKLNLVLEKIEWNQEVVKNNPFISALVATGILIPVQEKEWPQQRDIFFVLRTNGSEITVYEYKWAGDRADRFNKATGNIFRTQAEAEAYCDQILNKSVWNSNNK